MRSIIICVIISLLFTACVQNDSGSTVTAEKTDSFVVKTDSSPVIKSTIHLDSIEATNNASVSVSGNRVTKAYVSKEDSTIDLRADIRLDHRIFGYVNPDIHSERLLLFSVFTNDVEENPFGCKLGSYYDTGGMENIKLKYLETVGQFVKAMAIDNANKFTILYFEKKWIVFE